MATVLANVGRAGRGHELSANAARNCHHQMAALSQVLVVTMRVRKLRRPAVRTQTPMVAPAVAPRPTKAIESGSSTLRAGAPFWRRMATPTSPGISSTTTLRARAAAERPAEDSAFFHTSQRGTCAVRLCSSGSHSSVRSAKVGSLDSWSPPPTVGCIGECASVG